MQTIASVCIDLFNRLFLRKSWVGLKMDNLYAELIHSDCARSRFAVASRASKSLLIAHMSRLAVLTSLTVWFYLKKKKKLYTFYATNLGWNISHTSLHKWSGRPMHKSGGKISFGVNQAEWNEMDSVFSPFPHLYHRRIKKIALNFIRSSMFASGGDGLWKTWSGVMGVFKAVVHILFIVHCSTFWCC